MIIETEINVDVDDVAGLLTRTPEDLAYTLQKLARCDAVSQGRACAAHMRHDSKAKVANWLRAFADALAPEGAPFDQSWDIVVDRFDGETRLDPDTGQKLRLAAWPVYKAGLLDRFGSITAAGRELLATAPASAERAP